MGNKDLLLLVEALKNEKGISKDILFMAIQAGIESAIRKLSSEEMEIRVQLDPKTGAYQTYRCWDVVADEELEFPESQLTLAQAKERSPSAVIGERIEEQMPFVEFGRIATQTARQVIMQKVREAERDLIIQQYEPKVGQLVTGIAKRVTREEIRIDLGGKAEAILLRSETLPNEMFRMNDRVRAVLFSVSAQARGPQLLVSRIKNEMLIELFRIEVPEVGENIIEIKAAAREPGNRAKIAVKTNDGRIDPVGACVGMRGARVQAVSSELGGERVDIVLWDENPAQFVINAMAPADISSIVVDEDNHCMDLAVQKEQLSQAIGRNGQNVKLASQLTGWSLNVMTVEAFDEKGQQESTKIVDLFTSSLGIDEEIASLLVLNGFSSLEEIAYVPKEELLAIEDFDEEIVDELRDRANDTLLAQALNERQEENSNSDLAGMEGMTLELAEKLKARGIITVEELAEQSIDELLDLGDITEERAAQLIMKAREPWFL